MIILPKRTIYPKADIDGNPIRGDTLYHVIKWHEEIREGTKFIVYEQMQKFVDSKKAREQKNVR